MKPLALSCLLALVLPLTACTVPATEYRPYYEGGERHLSDLRRSHAGYYPPPPEGRWIWQPDLRLYTSAREPSLYYRDDGLFLRWNNGRWAQAPRYSGPWRSLDARRLPEPLRARHGHYREPARDHRSLVHEQRRLQREQAWQRQQHLERREAAQRHRFEQQHLEQHRERQKLRQEAERREYRQRQELLRTHRQQERQQRHEQWHGERQRPQFPARHEHPRER